MFGWQISETISNQTNLDQDQKLDKKKNKRRKKKVEREKPLKKKKSKSLFFELFQNFIRKLILLVCD